ncbi:MAG TPA: NAD-dependent epimerase/dehydratase family protein [Xanthobacteraceae bacterium]|nr:NAD-dependent epimerase/dehydratase family protein [Xanthobacteraceae bacterium]
MTKVLITGASGFIGRPVVAALAGGSDAVRAAVRRPPQPAFAPTVEVMQHLDLRQSFDWAPLLAGVGKVVHLAGVTPSHREAPDHYDAVNRAATARLAAAAARAGVVHFVFVSSIRAQSGPSADHALSERDQAAPTDAYGRSKLAGEAAVRDSGVPFTILRPVPIYGPGVKGFLGLLLRAALSPLPLPLKDIVSRRSLLGIDNFVSALAFVLGQPAAGEIYVVADPGMPPKLADIVATLRRAQGRWPLIVPMSTDYVELPLRLIGRADLWERIGGSLRVDPGKLIAAGWQPVDDTRAGFAALAKTVAARKPPERGAR